MAVETERPHPSDNAKRRAVENPSPLCEPLFIGGTAYPIDVSFPGHNQSLKHRLKNALSGNQSCWGIPFAIDKAHIVIDCPIEFSLPSIKAPWLCFLHTAVVDPDLEIPWYEKTLEGLKASKQQATSYLNKLAGVYYIQYSDGSEVKFDVRYRHQINTPERRWGENSFEAIPHYSPSSFSHEDEVAWGFKQHLQYDGQPRSGDAFTHWICAWPNPHPDKSITGMRIEPGFGSVILSAVTASYTQATPIRWQTRKKILLTLPNDIEVEAPRKKFSSPSYQSTYRQLSDLRQQLIQLDMGTVISVVPRFAYDNAHWENLAVNTPGRQKKREFIVEYAAHPEANAYLQNGEVIPLSTLEQCSESASLKWIPPAEKSVVLRVINKQTRHIVAVRLHVHGQYDEYLAPVNRHRIPNGDWFEEYAPELAGPDMHTSTYIDGETVLKLPLGQIYVEVSKGFECRPIHKIIEVAEDTSEVCIEIEKVLDWKEKGWVTADTHVHFLSPATANLEGRAEGINVVNLLASQWGELMTNVGDFDGKTTFKNTETNDHYLVRVGTENRQPVLGHISLLGYQGPMITPLCAGGLQESAIGDPVDILMTEWAQMCRNQNGLVVFPHFPQPQAEHAATIVSGLVDAVEMYSYSNGILPMSLVSWYRYLNCGYHIPLVAGTDKMSTNMELGKIRAYSKLSSGQPFSYETWQDSIRQGNTFVTVGPLIEFSINGYEAGSRFKLGKAGGKVTVTWQVQTVIHQIIGVELIVNGELVEGKKVDNAGGEGYFEINIDRSSWVCLLVRGTPSGSDDEEILAHTSSVMIEVQGSEFFAVADAVSLLEQIEGSMAYLDHVGTRAETRRYKAMRLVLDQAHKKLHNRLHQLGFDHTHSVKQTHH